MPEVGLTILDKYENVSSGQYERLVVCVHHDGTNSIVYATTYISRDHNDNRLPPRIGYLDHMLAGADVLPAEWVAFLKTIPALTEQP